VEGQAGLHLGLHVPQQHQRHGGAEEDVQLLGVPELAPGRTGCSWPTGRPG
jgi:hypothetical protein